MTNSFCVYHESSQSLGMLVRAFEAFDYYSIHSSENLDIHVSERSYRGGDDVATIRLGDRVHFFHSEGRFIVTDIGGVQREYKH